MKTSTDRAECSWMRITGLLAFVGILGVAATGCGGDGQAEDPNTAVAQPPGVSISATPMVVPAQGSSMLTWLSTNATSCTASRAWSGSQAIAGTASTGALSQDSTFTLTCTGVGGATSASVTVTVGALPPPTVAISASPTSVAYGASSTVTWSSTNATSCTASGAWSGAQATAGSASTGALTANRTYTITCNGAGGSASQSVTVMVSSPAAPTVTISANPAINLPAFGQSTLQWSSTNATSCTASGIDYFGTPTWSGSRPTSGTELSVPITVPNQRYTLTCAGAGGSASASVVVSIDPTDPCLGCWDY
jgi:trimeric autotransporter adhesin